MRSAVGPIPMQFPLAGDKLENIVTRSRKGTEVWRTLVLLALPLLFLEGFLAQRFGRRG